MTLKPFQPRSESPSSDQPRTTGRRLSILYVEDEEANWDVVRLNLRDKFELTRARDAREAFALLGTSVYDAILMDIQLSGSELDGIQIAQLLKGDVHAVAPDFARGIVAKSTPIIFITAYTARYNEEQLKQVGGDAMISKPVDFVKLSFAISRHVLKGVSKS